MEYVGFIIILACIAWLIIRKVETYLKTRELKKAINEEIKQPVENKPVGRISQKPIPYKLRPNPKDGILTMIRRARSLEEVGKLINAGEHYCTMASNKTRRKWFKSALQRVRELKEEGVTV